VFYKVAFTEENLDYFISLILSHYISNNDKIDDSNQQDIKGSKKDEMISLTDFSLYLVRLIQSISVSGGGQGDIYNTKYQREFVL